MKQVINVAVTLRFAIVVDVEETEDQILAPEEEQIEEFVESLTPNDWESYGAFVDRPEFEIDTDDIDDGDTREGLEPQIAFKGGKFVPLIHADDDAKQT